MKAIFALTIFALTVVACRGPGGPVERAGRTVDPDVGTGIKKAGHAKERPHDCQPSYSRSRLQAPLAPTQL